MSLNVIVNPMKRRGVLVASVLIAAIAGLIFALWPSRRDEPLPAQRKVENPPLAVTAPAGGRNQVAPKQAAEAFTPQQKGRFTPAPTGVGVAVRMIRPTELANVGADSAQAALHTIHWAIAGGDTDVIEKMLFLPETVRTRLDELLQGQSEETRKHYGTPERLAALLIAAQKPTTGYLVSQDKEIDTGLRKLVVLSKNGTGKLDAMSQEFRLNHDGTWQKVVTLQQVNRWADVMNSDLYLAAVAGRK